MRLLFMNTMYMPDIGGGAEITLNTIASGLAERGHTVGALVLSPENKSSRSNVNGVTVYRIPYRNLYWPFTAGGEPPWKKMLWHSIDSYNPLIASAAAKVIEEFQPDALSLHNLQGLSSSIWSLVDKFQLPAIQVLHDYYQVCPKVTMFNNGRNCASQCGACKIFRLPHPRLSNNLSAVVAVSHYTLNTHLQAGLFEEVSVKKVIYNARRLPARQPPAKNERTLTIGFIGGLTPVKGIEQLLKAFKQIIGRTAIPLQLLVAGSGKDDYREHLMKLVEGLPVTFLGQVDPVSFYPQLDIAVIPSVWNEPLGGVVIEALYYGVPTIAAARGGIQEIIQHQVNGLLYDPETHGSLEDNLLTLINNPSLRKSISGQSADSISTFLDIQRFISEYDTLFQDVVTHGYA